ncbi:MAG: ABC transporter substrate-binding protein [Armatimonadota bacterium]|nr:ABC transporter substrate-binding protein [Armatimonadota bacterium]
MNARWRARALILLMVLVPLAGAHGQTGEPIKIGVLAEQTGFFSLAGQDAVSGARLFADEQNGRGGINGRPIELIIQDTASDPERAIIGARKLIDQDRVVAIVGLGLVSNAAAVAPIVATRGPVMLSVSGAFLPQQNQPMVFAFNPSVLDFMSGGMRWLQQQKKMKVALITTNDATGQVSERAYRILVRRYGMTSTGIEFFNPAATSAAAELTKIRDSGPDAVVAWTVGRSTGVIAAAVQQLGMSDRPFLTSAGNVSGAFLRQLQGMGADFFVMPVTKDILDVEYLDAKDPQYPLVKAYREAFVRRFNSAPSAVSGGAYDAMRVLTEAIRRAGTDQAALAKTIENMKGFVGVQGTYNFAPGRHRGLDAAVLIPVRVVKGQLVPAR